MARKVFGNNHYSLTRDDKDLKAIECILFLKEYCKALNSNDDGKACLGCEMYGNNFCNKYFKRVPCDWKTRGYTKGVNK